MQCISTHNLITLHLIGKGADGLPNHVMNTSKYALHEDTTRAFKSLIMKRFINTHKLPIGLAISIGKNETL